MSNGMIVKNNLAALNTLNIMNSNNAAKTKQGKKVSSGMKINGAADDASGYQISERMRVQIRSLDQANQNAQNGSSLMKTAEGAVSSTVEILKTLKEKVINAANGHNTDADLAAIQQELDQSIDQINDNAAIQFNGKYLTNGALSAATQKTGNTFMNRALDKDAKLTDLLAGPANGPGAGQRLLKDRDGNTMNFKIDDVITVSVVINGQTQTRTKKIEANTTLGDLLKLTGGVADEVTTGGVVGTDAYGVDVETKTPGISLHSGSYNPTVGGANTLEDGLEKAISGFSISVATAEGDIKKDVNKVLDNFTEVIAAADVSQDNRLNLQIGTKSNQSIAVSLSDMGARALGLQGVGGKNLNVESPDNAMVAINVLDTALQRALTEQTKIGAVQSRLEYTSKNLTTASENVTNSESTIRDADMGKEMTEYTKNSILTQTAQAMLAQANQSGQGVLSLLQ